MTNHIYTAEDAKFLAALPQERILGVETGGCPHTVFSNMKTGQGLAEIIAFIEQRGMLG